MHCKAGGAGKRVCLTHSDDIGRPGSGYLLVGVQPALRRLMEEACLLAKILPPQPQPPPPPPPGLPVPSAVGPKPWPPRMAELPADLWPLKACREQGVTHTGSQELSTAARLATGPLTGATCAEEEEEGGPCEGAFAESLLEPELEFEGLRLSRELENFHWGILGMSMQKVVVESCSPSRQGESARAAAPAEEEEEEDLGSSGGRGGRGRLGVEEGTTGVAATLPLMAKLCIRSSAEVTESLRKRSYFGFSSMPGEAALEQGPGGPGRAGRLTDEGLKGRVAIEEEEEEEICRGEKKTTPGESPAAASMLTTSTVSHPHTHIHTHTHTRAHAHTCFPLSCCCSSLRIQEESPSVRRIGLTRLCAPPHSHTHTHTHTHTLYLSPSLSLSLSALWLPHWMMSLCYCSPSSPALPSAEAALTQH